MQLTLTAPVFRVVPRRCTVPKGYGVRKLGRADLNGLAELYHASYPRDIVPSPEAADHEMRITFKGEYGKLDFDMSWAAENRGNLVCAVMTVERAPWPATPDGPFVIEVFTRPGHRRRGLAGACLAEAARSALERGLETLALRVDSENRNALRLYGRMGFSRWSP